MEYVAEIKKYIKKEMDVLENLSVEKINEVINVMENARRDNKQIFICGNGGSAMTAAHFICDFKKGVNENKTIQYNIECLSDNIPLMMAIANDICFEDIFVFPLKSRVQPGDVVIGISGSGNSENVIRAIEYANQQGAETIGMVGYNGGRLLKLAKHVIHAEISDMQVSEDVHMAIMHMLMQAISKTAD